MAEKDLFRMVVGPILTERSTGLKELHNQYVMEVSREATKTDIKHAVEELFKVDVERVRTMIVPGKFRRQGKYGGLRPDWKKAIVTVKAGQKIDFAEKTGA